MSDQLPTPQDSLVVLLQSNVDALENRAESLAAELSATCKELAAKQRELELAKFQSAVTVAHAQLTLRSGFHSVNQTKSEVARA